jgi:hypothetical protein
VVGDDGEPNSSGLQRVNVVGNEAIIVTVIAKFFIRPCVQMEVCPPPLRAMREEFLNCVAP